MWPLQSNCLHMKTKHWDLFIHKQTAHPGGGLVKGQSAAGDEMYCLSTFDFISQLPLNTAFLNYINKMTG